MSQHQQWQADRAREEDAEVEELIDQIINIWSHDYVSHHFDAN
jgi:hypothetical protein